jgi:hypothetical protein
MPAQLAEGGRSHGSSEEEDRDEEEGPGEEAGEKEDREEEEVTIVAISDI